MENEVADLLRKNKTDSKNKYKYILYFVIAFHLKKGSIYHIFLYTLVMPSCESGRPPECYSSLLLESDIPFHCPTHFTPG